MKKTFYTGLLILLTIQFSKGQNATSNWGNPNEAFKVDLFLGSSQANEYKKLAKENKLPIEGSPYLNDKFVVGKVSGFEDNLMLRYNAYADEIEVDRGESTIYAIRKETPFNEITIQNGLMKLKLCSFENKNKEIITGYFVEVSKNNNIGLLRKDKIIYTEGKQSITSFETSFPSRFVATKSKYYLELNNRIFSFPDSKKQFIAEFPNKKTEISEFINKNKIDFNKEQDLIKLTNFISTLT